MLNKVPLENQVEIIKRLPVKPLIQFRSVSKAWKSMIDTSDFIARYSGQQHHILLRFVDSVSHKRKYVSIIDDDTFPQQRVNLTIPGMVWFKEYSIIGCFNGLLCLYVYYNYSHCGLRHSTGMFILWNLSIRKAVAVIGKYSFLSVVGFGVCCKTSDPKIVKITKSCNSWQVELFTLSTGSWRSSYGNLPRSSITFGLQHVDVDGFLYWLGTVNDGNRSYIVIILFDITTEEFREINLPDTLAFATHTNRFLCISKLRNSLLVLDRGLDNPVVFVWMMEDGVPKSFTKLFTVSLNEQDSSIIGFRKSGEPIVESVDDEGGQLVVYESYSKDMANLCIYPEAFTVAVHPYMETLLLFDQPDLMVYNDILCGKLRKRLLKHTK